MGERVERGRVYYFDYLRVVATFAVILLHISAKFWMRVPVDSYEWRCFNAYESCVRWCVPVFVMISGALFLRSNINIKRLYKKNILHILTAFIFWSILYALASYYCKGSEKDVCITELFQGHYHMWFLFMIIGLYIISPLLKPIIQSVKLTEYFLFWGVLLTMVIPCLVFCLSYLDSAKVEVFNGILNRFNISMVLGYSSYFVLGYYLSHKDLTKKWRVIIYLLGLLGFVSTVYLTALYSQYEGAAVDAFYSFFSVTVAFEAMGVFVFFKYNVGKKRNWLSKLMMGMSMCSFGAYLVHTMVIERWYEWVGINAMSFNPAISVLALGSIVFVISFLISAILNLIPVAKDYIV